VAVSRKIAELQQKIAKNAAHPASAASVAGRPDPPQLAQAKALLRVQHMAIEAKKHEQAALELQVRNYQARVEARPEVEEEFKQITRDHDTALQFYNSLLNKMNNSTMATALEQHQEGEQFQVIDAANLPDAPTFPNHFIFAGGGFAGGLLIGLLISALLEYRDTSLRNERDIWAFTKLPTLAIVSHVDGIEPSAQKRKRGRWFSRSKNLNESLAG
jgi:uncharacterized protein involved in exopolysaccharide biosynthesis